MAGPEPANPNPDRVADESRIEQQLDRAVAARPPARRRDRDRDGVDPVTVGAGLLMTVADSEHFPSIGSGSGGPSRPSRPSGTATTFQRVSRGGSSQRLVMLVGIGFLTVITASITSTFVSRVRHEERRPGAETATAEQVGQLTAGSNESRRH